MTPHNDGAGLGGLDIHTSGTQVGSITEPQIYGISVDNISQVSGTRFRLHIKGLPFHNLPVKVQQNSGLVLPPLGQSALNVVKVRHRPWYCKVHGSEIAHQVL